MAANPSVGRPRSGPRRMAGATLREEILDAAAELFTQQGYAATSTRAIAEAAGVKQSSLYYHFANKEQILFDLLLATVQPTRAVAAALHADAPAVPPAVQLWALAAYDVRLLSTGPWNLAALYLLPELRADRFAPFHQERRRLREEYGRLVAGGVRSGDFTAIGGPRTATRLAFGLVETVIALRQESGGGRSLPVGVDELVEAVADSVLRLLGFGPDGLGAVRRDASAWLARHAGGRPPDQPPGRGGDPAPAT